MKWYQSRTVESKLGAPTPPRYIDVPKAAKKAAVPDPSQLEPAVGSERGAPTCRPRQYIDRGRRRRRKN
eukprot:3629352-Prymnesium_polylepis.1